MRQRRRRRPQRVEKQKTIVLANEKITHPEVRVISHDGTMLGVMTPAEGMEKARELEMDLVMVNPKAEPPVTKIADVNKYKYQMEKDKRSKKGRKVEVKGVRISIRISENDLMFKARMADKFMDQGHKIRIELVLRGREKGNREFAKQTFGRFIEALETPVKVEQEAAPQRLGLAMVVAKNGERRKAGEETEEDSDE